MVLKNRKVSRQKKNEKNEKKIKKCEARVENERYVLGGGGKAMKKIKRKILGTEVVVTND